MAKNPIDPDISLWILEFLLRQPIEDRILLSLAAVLPNSENNFVIPKLFLLQKIQSEVTNCVISETVLDLFDQISELDQCLTIKDCPDSLKKAYCDVAVECTVRCLRNCNYDVKGEYFDMVKRVWRGRVREMEGKGIGLVSGELLEWKCDVEAAVFEKEVCRKVVEKSKGIDAAEAVRFYLKDEKLRMGPSFLELVSEKLKQKETEIRGGICSRKRGESDVCHTYDGEEQEFGNNNGSSHDKGKIVMVDTNKSNLLSGIKHGGGKRSRLATSTSSRGAKIADVDDSGAGPSGNDNLLETPDVEKVHEEVGSNRLGAESGISISIVVNNDLEPPGEQNLELPRGQNRGKSSVDNAENAQTGEANVGVENMDLESPRDQNRGKHSGVDNAMNPQPGEANSYKGNCSGQRSARNSLMERNKTACTFEWDDSIDRSSVELPSSSGKPQVPKKKREKKSFSIVEEDTLRAGVQRFGIGQWKVILNAFSDIFVGRTEVNLKDKWRNMIRQR